MSSHSTYPQAGAGPSFYQHSPPPHHVYGNHSPGPRPNYQYSYPVPPPPHLNSHQPPQFQQSPSRGNHRQNAAGGGPNYTTRGALQYHNYHPAQQHQFLQPHVSPQLGPHPQQQQQQQHIPFSPQSAKYNQNQPFSPSYHYPSPTAPVFTPSWQSQQPISPLPKQLSMPPPQNIQTFHEPSLASPPGLSQSSQSPVPYSENEIKPEPPAPSTPTPTPPSPIEPASDPQPGTPVLSQAPYTSTYSHMGTISTSDAVTLVPSQSSPQSSSHTLPLTVNPIAKWAIWSRRPQDPSHAPSIIISPRARPPPDVVQQAIDLRTPPESQPSSPSQSTTILPVVVEESFVVTQETTIETAEEEDDVSIPQPGEDVESSSSVTSSSVVAPPQTSTPSPVPPQEVPEVPVVPAIVKKSWADLLRTPTSSSSSQASPLSGPALRNALPTSSVIGFSIPAASLNPAVPVSPSKKSELITLLTIGPSPDSTAAGTIRPRGIVNSGNMCYANSVLQLLVYCTPFQRLFAELGKVLSGGSAVTGSDSLVNGFGPLSSSTSTSPSGSTSTPINGLNGKDKEKDKDAVGMTPLVDATVEFLREFMDDKKTKPKTKKQVHSKKGSVHVNGTGTSKGKEKETLLDGFGDDDISEVDWEACDSFLPTYVYDAMKLKKRFDHMRGGHQEDAEEFFGFYLETLEEELLSLLHAVDPPKSKKTDAAAAVEEKEEAAPPEDDGWMEVGKRNRTVITRTIKATESPITRIFSGRFRTTVRAPGQKDSATVDHWNLLRLDIQRDHIHTVQDALSGISQAQSVQLTQSTRPGVIIEGQQQSLIEVLPSILVLQMKRFGYDMMGVAKVGKQVRFGPELEIGYDLMVPAAKKAHPPKYKLFGVLYHHGFSASGGHYTLDVLHPNRYPGSVNAKNREGWVRIDDELVSDVRHDDVFGAYERDDARCAYLLFYRRIL